VWFNRRLDVQHQLLVVAGRMTCARFVAAAAVLIVVTAACARSQPDEEQTRPAIRAQAQPGGSRLFEASRWDTAYVIGGQLQDTTLLLPRLIAAGDGSVYVYDVGRHELVAFDVSGAQRWRFGREGAGPGEFRNPIDVTERARHPQLGRERARFAAHRTVNASRRVSVLVSPK
jgi:hypothetical protein